MDSDASHTGRERETGKQELKRTCEKGRHGRRNRLLVVILSRCLKNHFYLFILNFASLISLGKLLSSKIRIFGGHSASWTNTHNDHLHQEWFFCVVKAARSLNRSLTCEALWDWLPPLPVASASWYREKWKWRHYLGDGLHFCIFLLDLTIRSFSRERLCPHHQALLPAAWLI